MAELRDGPRACPPTLLVGEEQAAYSEFCSAAQALEQHQQQGGPIMERYRAALGRLSAVAGKAVRDG